VIFENVFKFSKRRHAVPLRPMWTIMVAAKLDHSRVFLTKFHQNRSTLNGRSAGQRHTDRQTNLAENNGPLGLQSGQKNNQNLNQQSTVRTVHMRVYHYTTVKHDTAKNSSDNLPSYPQTIIGSSCRIFTCCN